MHCNLHARKMYHHYGPAHPNSRYLAFEQDVLPYNYIRCQVSALIPNSGAPLQRPMKLSRWWIWRWMMRSSGSWGRILGRQSITQSPPPTHTINRSMVSRQNRWRSFQGFIGHAIKFALQTSISQRTITFTTVALQEEWIIQKLVSPVDWYSADCIGLAPPAAGHWAGLQGCLPPVVEGSIVGSVVKAHLSGPSFPAPPVAHSVPVRRAFETTLWDRPAAPVPAHRHRSRPATVFGVGCVSLVPISERREEREGNCY